MAAAGKGLNKMTFEEYDAKRNKYFRITYSDGSALIVREANKRDARKHGREDKKRLYPNVKVIDVQEMPEAEFKEISKKAIAAFYKAMNIKQNQKRKD